MNRDSLARAKELALDALHAYKEHEEKLLRAYKDRRLTVIERANVRLFVAETEDSQKIVFAGSDDLWDWLGNITAWKVMRTEIGRVHDGFADCYARVRPDLENILDPGKRLTFAGHSLGGALAQIAAVQAVRRGHTVECVHTFGAPMVGNSDWAAFYDACKIETHCWVAGWDRVPLQPSFLGFRLGYRRVSGWRFLALDGTPLRSSPGLLSGKSWRPWRKRRMNHSLETYLDALGRIIPAEGEGIHHAG